MFDVSCEVCVNIEVKTKVAGLQLNKSSFFLGGGMKQEKVYIIYASQENWKLLGLAQFIWRVMRCSSVEMTELLTEVWILVLLE